MTTMKLKGLLVLGSLALLAACNVAGDENTAQQESLEQLGSAAIAKINCDVTTAGGTADCTNNNAAWAKACCPAGQVGTGNCAVTQQRCVQPTTIPSGGTCGKTDGMGGCTASGSGSCTAGTSCQPPASGGGTSCTCR